MADTPVKKKPAAATARKAEGTIYQVQRIYDGAEGTPASSLELWEDVAVLTTSAGGEKACKLAASQLGGGEKEPKGGRYRAFPLRSDSRLDVQAQQQVVVTYSKPVKAAPAQTNGGT